MGEEEDIEDIGDIEEEDIGDIEDMGLSLIHI